MLIWHDDVFVELVKFDCFGCIALHCFASTLLSFICSPSLMSNAACSSESSDTRLFYRTHYEPKRCHANSRFDLALLLPSFIFFFFSFILIPLLCGVDV